MPTRPTKRERLYRPSPKSTGQSYTRVRSAGEYHTERWKRESKAFRAIHPLCAMCEQQGVIAPAEVTDHIIPFPVCEDFYDSSNWQSLCRKHNAEKGNKDKKLIVKFKSDYK